MKDKVRQIAIPLGALLCLFPFVNSAEALLLGMAIALTLGNTYQELTLRLSKKMLSLCVVGLGAGMNLLTVAQAGLHGIGYTAVSIGLTMVAGITLGRLLRTQREVSWLVSAGTAICGGSAIAAIAPVIHAKPHAVSVSLAVVFLLNAIALLVFPAIGHGLDMTQSQFGLWCALAIHDTSSVVGAGMRYGAEALQVATTIKLARALWIVPLAMVVGAIYAGHAAQESGTKRKYPWFILGFLAMSALVTWVPFMAEYGHVIETIAKRGLILTLFLIGANLSPEGLRTVGAKPLVQGVVLWILVAGLSLMVIKAGLIS